MNDVNECKPEWTTLKFGDSGKAVSIKCYVASNGWDAFVGEHQLAYNSLIMLINFLLTSASFAVF